MKAGRGSSLHDFRLADVIVDQSSESNNGSETIEDSEGQILQETTQALNEENKRSGLTMNFEKTKTLVFGKRDCP